MIRIEKTKAGFHVNHTGKNGEILNSGETLKTKQAAFKEILSDAKENFPGCNVVTFYDCTNERKGKVKTFRIFPNGVGCFVK